MRISIFVRPITVLLITCLVYASATFADDSTTPVTSQADTTSTSATSTAATVSTDTSSTGSASSSTGIQTFQSGELNKQRLEEAIRAAMKQFSHKNNHKKNHRSFLRARYRLARDTLQARYATKSSDDTSPVSTPST